MIFYNRQHEKIETDDLKCLRSGDCASVFYYTENMVFKEYYSDTEYCYGLDEKMFDILKDVKNPHFIELFDVYACFGFFRLFAHKLNLTKFYTSAYTARYYPDNSVKAPFEHKDYILDNFRELEQLFAFFTKNAICTKDVRKANAIFSKEGIIIIDPDLFYISESSEEVISALNKKQLLHLFKTIFTTCIEDQHYFELYKNPQYKDPDYKKKLIFIDDELANIEVTENTDVTYEISKKLKYVKRPIELFRR